MNEGRPRGCPFLCPKGAAPKGVKYRVKIYENNYRNCCVIQILCVSLGIDKNREHYDLQDSQRFRSGGLSAKGSY